MTHVQDKSWAQRELPWLASAALAIFFSSAACMATRGALRDFSDEHLLEADFSYVSGQITGHKFTSGRGGGTHTATALYSVNGQSYSVTLEGGGATEEKLPNGSSVDVKYSNSNPSISDATARNAETKRWSPIMLVIPWSLAGAVWTLSLLAWAQSHPLTKSS